MTEIEESKKDGTAFDFDRDGKLSRKDFFLGLVYLFRLIFVGVAVGLVAGLVGVAFSELILLVTAFRKTHDWVLFFLPLAGIGIVFFYHLLKDREDRGTNLIIDSLSGEEPVPIRKAPEIFVATVISHLFGASVGREGAALQLGGSIGYNMGKLFRFRDEDRKVVTMCGMSAVFSALFETPLTAAFFAMEVSNVGVIQYSALIPCVIASLTANGLALFMGYEVELFTVHIVPTMSIGNAVLASILAILSGFVSILLCVSLHRSGKLFKKMIANPYIRIAVGGAIVIALTMLLQTRAYNGAGMDIIEEAFKGEAPHPAFLLKMLFTAISLGAGFKGGEIVPSLYIGATFGSLYANLFGLKPDLCAAIGMGSLFCGATNCPVSSLFICLELFGYAGMPYYLIAIAMSYAFSGYYSLYSSQNIRHSKLRNRLINRKGK